MASRTLHLVRLEDRCQPANVTWLGGTSSEWNTGANWEGGFAPTPDDTAILSGDRTNAPTIAAGSNIVIFGIELRESAKFDLTINGALYTKGSMLNPTEPHGIVGWGALKLDSKGSEVDHLWTKGYVKVSTVEVRDDGVLKVEATFGQLGPNGGGPSSLEIGAPVGGGSTAGTVLLNGDHFVGFDNVYIRSQGTVKYQTAGTLTDVPPPPPNLWSPFKITNNGLFLIAEGQAVSFTGGSYLQQAAGAAVPITNFNASSTLSIAGFAGSTGAPAYSFDVTAGIVEAYESASVGARTDIRVQDAVFNFYSPGVFTRNNGPEQVSTFIFTARDGLVAKETLIKNTPVKFLDFNPVGRYTSATQVGGIIGADGTLKLDGSTELVLRVDVGNNRMDVIGRPTTNLITLNGDALKLTLNVRNSPTGQIMFAFNNFMWAQALSAPTPPFSGGVVVNGGGWTATITVDSNTLDLAMIR